MFSEKESYTKGGLLLVYKNQDFTSFQIVHKLRRILNVKKIGHAGTLDKAAEGLLLVCFGKSTKLLKFLVSESKKYIADIYFGKQTTTDDIEGDVLSTYDGEIDLQKIKKYLPNFMGKIKQIPPDYSAVHVNGMRAYKIAHVKKEKPKIKERTVEIYDLKTTSFNPPVLNLEIRCSSGTYIRSIARDIGILTGYYAHLYHLKRTSIGNFDIKNSYTTSDIEAGKYEIITPFNFLDMPALKIKEEYINELRCGKKIHLNWFEIKSLDISDGYYKVHFDDELLAILIKKNSQFMYDLVF